MANDDLSYLNDVLSGQPAQASASSSAVNGGASSTSSASRPAAGQGTNGSTKNENDSITVRTSAQAEDDAQAQSLDMSSPQPILQALKVSLANDEEFENMSEESISALLAKLDNADLVTEGLENRLDQLLGELDGMLENLESSSADGVEKEIEDAVTSTKDGSASKTSEDIQDGKLVNH